MYTVCPLRLCTLLSLPPGECCFRRLKIFTAASAPDSVVSCLEAATKTRYYSVQTGFRLSALVRPEFIENFVKAGEVTVYTQVKEPGGSYENLVGLSPTGDNDDYPESK